MDLALTEGKNLTKRANFKLTKLTATGILTFSQRSIVSWTMQLQKVTPSSIMID
jgi:hypothetical protein